MATDRVFSTPDFKKCIEFHGHICPGLAIGYKAAKAGMAWLEENRAEDEELVAIVETDACGADALQVLTGCTFGKGNFFYRDYGKQAFTLAERKSGRAVRLALKPGVLELNKRHRHLIDQLREGKATEGERKEFQALHLKKSWEILEIDPESLFTIQRANLSLPPKARIDISKPCPFCGEPTMESKLAKFQGKDICRACLKDYEA
jgi:formylmethanofuran dehydrogenase subunit E